MTPVIPALSPLFEFQLPRNISGTDFGTGYGGTVCGFHTRPKKTSATELDRKERSGTKYDSYLPFYAIKTCV